MKKAIAKKDWDNFEITIVKLNPEQAVLSCCSQDWSRVSTEGGLTCHDNCTGTTGAGSGSES